MCDAHTSSLKAPTRHATLGRGCGDSHLPHSLLSCLPSHKHLLQFRLSNKDRRSQLCPSVFMAHVHTATCSQNMFIHVHTEAPRGHSPRSPPSGTLCGRRCRWQRRRSRALRRVWSRGCPRLEGKPQVGAAPGPRGPRRSPSRRGGSQTSGLGEDSLSTAQTHLLHLQIKPSHTQQDTLLHRHQVKVRK